LKKSSGFGTTSSGFGAVGGGGFLGKSENGFGKSETGFGGGGDSSKLGFKRLAGTTSSSWGNSSSSSQEEVKEKKAKLDVKTGEEDEKNVLEVTTAKLLIAVHNSIANVAEEFYE